MSPEYHDHMVVCTGCGIPWDEQPDSGSQWLVFNNIIPCPAGNPVCEGHTLGSRVYCIRCQEEKKHEVQPHPSNQPDITT